MFVRIPPVVLALLARFSSHNCGTLAAALAFSGLMSAFPIALLAVAVFGYALGSPERAVSIANDFASSFMPGQNRLVAETFARVAQSYHVAGAAGLFGLLLGGSAFFGQLELSMNIIFEVERPRAWYRSRALAMVGSIAALIWIAASVAASFLQTVGSEAVLRFGAFVGLSVSGGAVERAISTVVSIVLSTVAATAIYRRMPNRRIPLFAAVIGAAWVAIGWELAKVAFALYLSRYASYDRLYGPIAGVAIAAIWLYYSMTLLLLGAECVAMLTARSVDLK